MNVETEWVSNASPTDRARAAARSGAFLRAGEIDAPPAILSRLTHDGELVRIARGVYLGAEVEPHPLAESAAISMKFPRAVLGLATALEFHRLTTSWADGTWILVPRDRNPPQEEGVHVVRVVPTLLDGDLGISTLEVHGVQVKITNPVRTVLDCWKYTRRVSHTVAVEALRTLRGSDHWNGAAVLRLARAVGVWTRIRPYVEALG